jgi:hypothetical protein
VPGSADPALIKPVTGRRNPLRGWRSKSDLQLTPAWSIGFEAPGVREHEFRTQFCFGGERPPTAAPGSPFDR